MPEFNSSPDKFLEEIFAVLKNLSITIQKHKINYVEEFSKGTDVWEGYTLKEHTLLVLNQFYKYDIFDGITFPEWADKEAFRIMLSLHDIGKPFAISISSKSAQGGYNQIFVKDIMQKLGISNPDLYAELVSEDIIGKYIKRDIDVYTAIHRISKQASNCNLDVNKYYKLLKIYYMCDSGSYTVDSGGKASLDYLFIFNRRQREICFSNKVAQEILALNVRFQDLI